MPKVIVHKFLIWRLKARWQSLPLMAVETKIGSSKFSNRNIFYCWTSLYGIMLFVAVVAVVAVVAAVAHVAVAVAAVVVVAVVVCYLQVTFDTFLRRCRARHHPVSMVENRRNIEAPTEYLFMIIPMTACYPCNIVVPTKFPVRMLQTSWNHSYGPLAVISYKSVIIPFMVHDHPIL